MLTNKLISTNQVQLNRNIKHREKHILHYYEIYLLNIKIIHNKSSLLILLQHIVHE